MIRRSGSALVASDSEGSVIRASLLCGRLAADSARGGVSGDVVVFPCRFLYCIHPLSWQLAASRWDFSASRSSIFSDSSALVARSWSSGWRSWVSISEIFCQSGSMVLLLLLQGNFT